MLLCPDCFSDLSDAEVCNRCNWCLTTKANIPIFMSRNDLSDTALQKYLQNYEQISEDDLSESIQDESYIKIQTKKLFSYLENIENKKICEVGIGKGYLFDMLIKAKPAKLVGIDISVPYLSKYNSLQANANYLQLMLANAENIPYKNEFDLIVAADILEHVLNVGDFLYSVNRALQLGGTFVVRTPYNEDINMYAKLVGCKYNFVHLRNFSKQTLNTVLKGAGFKVVKYHFDGFYAYKKRKLFSTNKFINFVFDKCMRTKYKSIHTVAGINNIIGNILMKPSEMVAVCKKIKDITP